MRQYHCESLADSRLLASVSIFSENFEGHFPGWYTGYTNNSPMGHRHQRLRKSNRPFRLNHDLLRRHNFDGTSQNPIVPPNTNADTFHTIDLTGDANHS